MVTSGSLDNPHIYENKEEDVLPDPVDIHVGLMLRLARIENGMTQARLADIIKLSTQQILKYEHAQNRISASRLWKFSHILGKKPFWFFSGYNATEEANIPKINAQLNKRATIQLIAEFSKISEDSTRKSFLNLMRSLEGKGDYTKN